VHIAILEDDVSLAEFISICLSSSGHSCKIFITGQDFIDNIPTTNYDLYIIDWELPDINGDIVLKWIRDNFGFHTPVLFSTRHDTETDVVKILQLGADDYIVKPLKPLVLMARINALLRRSALYAKKPKFISLNNIYIDMDARTVTLNKLPCNLTPKEFKLTSYLFQNLGTLISREELLHKIWNTSSNINTRTIDIHISRIRKKLKLDEAHGWDLHVVYQSGYRLESLTSNKTILQ